MESVSRADVVQLGQEVLNGAATNDADGSGYEQRSNRIAALISTSTSLRIVGYYLRAVPAAGQQHLETQHIWVGCINHLRMSHCSLRLTGNGKLVQIKAIRAGDTLTFDYGTEWWPHRLTGVTWVDWMGDSASCRRGTAELFHRMHERVLELHAAAEQKWDERLSAAASEMTREAVMMELWEYLEEKRPR
jgi:hypothetical protein